ncbi:hypothetical protein YTPLAS18_06240 [Nitrospira sp.]|nr:hypothetical protein YTPLAS18_06240 [Nitrospira sp.]
MYQALVVSAVVMIAVLAGSPAGFALQSGGVEIGDLETGSVVGQPFREIPVDLEFQVLEGVGGKSVWYPPVAILKMVGRAGTPVLLKVSNGTKTEQSFGLAAEENISAPTTLNVKLTLKPGETKYVGIPTSDLTYVTAGSVLRYHSLNDKNVIGGQLLVMK